MVSRAWLIVAVLSLCSSAGAEDKVLFDFEDYAAVKDWAPLAIEGSKLPGAKEPAAKMELTTEGATSGKRALKVTFDGGVWPTITTTAVPVSENWVVLKFQAFKADVTVSRTCLVGFRVLMENRKRDDGHTWAVTLLCKPGRNEISQALGGWWTGMTGPSADGKNPGDGKITGIDFFMYCPHPGESVLVDNIRITADRLPQDKRTTSFKVLGTDLVVKDVTDLGKKLKDQWKAPVEKPIDAVEAEFKAKLDALKAAHPKAVLAILRDGEKGFDPAVPDKVFKGWSMRYMNSHGPDSNIVARASNSKGWGAIEVFMRHRSPMMRVDLSSIPAGAEVLAAELVLTRNGPVDPAKSGCFKPNMFAAEAANRPWVDAEVNAYEYAKDKFWKTVGGMIPESYEGDDPDFLPLFIAHGPSTGVVNTWDFTDAVKLWTSGKQPNCGFFMHGDAVDLVMTFSPEAKEVTQRPTVMVIYEPK